MTLSSDNEARPVVTLAECPPGPFLFEGTLGFKTEYGAMETVGPVEVPGSEVRWTVGNRPDAYVLASGEFFWGGAKTHEERAALLVSPVDMSELAFATTSHTVDREAWQPIETAPKDEWIVGLKAGWEEGSVSAPYFIGKRYDFRTDALIDPSKGRWCACSHWMSLSANPLSPSKQSDGIECHGLDTPERVCFYEQDFYVLSNFSSFTVRWGPYTFPTSEHMYHWRRFFLAGGYDADKLCDLIMNAPSAHDAFRIAQDNKAHQVDHWNDVKVGEMREILRLKADQHEYVRRKLLATGDRELVENSWRDDYWGWGPNRDGQNMLGKLWMEVRAELRATPTHDGTGEASA